MANPDGIKSEAGTNGVKPGQLHSVQEGIGPPIILIHGFGESVFSWRFLMPALVDRNRVTAIDLKGHGRSPKPRDGRYSLRDQAELILGFLAERQVKHPIIVGHSMGGGIALLVALRLQENGADARKLILIDSIAYEQPLPLFVKLLRTPILAAVATRLVPVRRQARTVLKLAYFDDSKIPPDAVEAYAAPLRERGGRHALIETARNLIPDDLGAIVSQYSGLTAPTLIIWGRHDRITPLRIGNMLDEAMPHSALRVLDGAGHVPHEETPEATNRLVLDFVR